MTLSGPMWRVRFGLQTDAISGDDGQPGTLGTFANLETRPPCLQLTIQISP
jgi:hypothetical protein